MVKRIIKDYIGDISLGEGETRRFNHTDCPSFGNHRADTRERLYITRRGSRLLAYCHNCGYSSSELYRGHSSMLTEPTRWETNPKQKENITYRLPKDCTRAIPRLGLKWLLKYGITLEELGQYDITYSPSYRRIIIPVIDYDISTTKRSIVSWQGRTLEKVTKDNPKYISAKGAKHNGGLLYKTSVCCMVEDMLSAIKVARVCSAMCLSGSHVSDKIISRLTSFNKIFLWLDLDKADKSTYLSSRITSVLGIPCRSIITELDPKEYNTNEIARQTEGRG